MIAFILGCFVIGFLIAIPVAGIKYKKLSKRDNEITQVDVKSISGNKFTFAVHYGDEVQYETQMSWSKRGKMLLSHVKD